MDSNRRTGGAADSTSEVSDLCLSLNNSVSSESRRRERSTMCLLALRTEKISQRPAAIGAPRTRIIRNGQFISAGAQHRQCQQAHYEPKNVFRARAARIEKNCVA